MEEKDEKDKLLSKSVTPEALEINKKLIAAFKAGPTATREFLDSEEGMSDACREILRKPWVDNNPDDDKVSVTDAPDTVVTELIPTQRFIDLMQSVSFPLSSADSLVKSIQSKKGFGTIIISKSAEGMLIIDGHHRWSGIFGIAPDGKIDAKLVNWPGVNAKEKLASSQLAIAAWKGSGPQPSKGGEPKFNILGKPTEEIKKMILDNVNNPEVVDPKVKEFGGLLNDKMIEDIIANPEIIFTWAGIEEGEKDVKVIRETIATKVANNLSKMKNFVEGAPPREDMPQFDPDIGGPNFKDIEPDLKAGKYNVSPSYFSLNKESKYIRTFESFVKSKRK